MSSRATSSIAHLSTRRRPGYLGRSTCRSPRLSTSAELFERAWQYHQANLLSEAEQLYRQGLHYDPRNVDGWCLLAEVCQTQGRLEEAAACYQQALEIQPHRLDLINQLGNIGTQFGAAGNFSVATVCFQQVLRFKPDYAEAHNNLGMML